MHKLAACQRGKGVVWSGVLRDGVSVGLLLREQFGARGMGFEGAGGELVWGNGRRSSHEGLREAGRNGVWTGCMGACTLGGECSQVPPGAPGETHGRERHVRGKGAPEEPGGSMRSSRGEARDGREAGGLGHPKVHTGADCAKCPNLAQERSQQEVERGQERGAHARSKEGHKSL